MSSVHQNRNDYFSDILFDQNNFHKNWRRYIDLNQKQLSIKYFSDLYPIVL